MVVVVGSKGAGYAEDMVKKSRAQYEVKYLPAEPVICGSSIVPLAAVAGP